jgi:hypothetical protein
MRMNTRCKSPADAVALMHEAWRMVRAVIDAWRGGPRAWQPAPARSDAGRDQPHLAHRHRSGA